jgi:hypothetical protein
MLKIPGKSCGPCTHCCKVLYIEELKKPANRFAAIATSGAAAAFI